MKPILFNTADVRAILEGRKTVMRRVVKPQPPSNTHPNLFVEPPYRSNDTIYVRETWKQATYDYAGGGCGLTDTYLYKADEPIDTTRMMVEERWHSSIHMPREAARLFLRVTDVRVERLQDITDEQAALEGTEKEYQHYADNVITEREVFSAMWNSTLKPADRNRYGWEANPWVFVISFERITKDEAMQ